jgi:hypothetical protein
VRVVVDLNALGRVLVERLGQAGDRRESVEDPIQVGQDERLLIGRQRHEVRRQRVRSLPQARARLV